MSDIKCQIFGMKVEIYIFASNILRKVTMRGSHRKISVGELDAGNWQLRTGKSKRIELSHFYTNANWNGDKKKVAILFETKKYSPVLKCLVDCLRT